MPIIPLKGINVSYDVFFFTSSVGKCSVKASVTTSRTCAPTGGLRADNDQYLARHDSESYNLGCC